MIHTTTRTLEVAGFHLNGFIWTLFLDQIVRFAVPMFFMISGFTLELNYDFHPNFLYYLKRRFSRIFIPYVFWSTFYFFLIYTGNNEKFFYALLTGGASYQLYFIPTLCIFYLIFPLLHKFYNFVSNKWILGLLLVSQIGFLLYDYYVKEFTYPDPIRVAILAYFVFIIGMIAARHKDRITEFVVRTKKYLLLGIGILGFFITAQGRYLYFRTFDIKAFYSQWRPDILIYTVCLGAFLFYLFGQKRFQSAFFEKLSGLSFFVFFIHVAILEYVWRYIGNGLFNLISGNIFGRFIFDPLIFILTSSTSLLIAYLVHKLPHLSKLTG